ncbi:MAG TPA: hypothetical protein VGR60_09420 [Gemmatimonadales bacterium]|nr:hypothetical protein [Gemmatimonadales bacterium]
MPRALSQCLLAVSLAALSAAPMGAQAPVALPTPTPIHWRTGPLDFTGPARAGTYLSATGRRAIVMGDELGHLEAWAWPLKLLHGFQLRFQTPFYAEPIAASELARRVDITPAGFTITYTHPAFTVRERVFVAEDDPAAVIVLEVDAVRPIEILAEFQSDLQLAWPGAVGGQYVYWDDAERAFVLAESRRQYSAMVGSPYTTSATNQPAHNVPEAPNQLRIAVGDQGAVPMPRPGEPEGRLVHVHASGIPIVIVGGAMPRDSVRALYDRVLASVPALYDARAAHAAAVTDSAVSLHSGDADFDRAISWAALDLDAAMVCNPDLGCGLVAGYGPSGARGARPGFGWFFGGDASINSLATTAAGEWDLTRRGLEFFAKYQRADGKIAHEISQAAGRIDWFKSYPYPFYHADTTPYWILAWGEYWLTTGDTASLRRNWPAIRKAYEWSRSTIDPATGLMLNSKGGLGAVEVGDLGLGVQSDIYLSGVWVRALDRMARMADAMGDKRLPAEARALAERARASLRERFWLPAVGRHAFALLDSGQTRPELTVWPSIPLALGLFADDHAFAEGAAQARATLVTDWGARSLASESHLFDPMHYNNGTVWPFVTGWSALGQFAARDPYAGWTELQAIANAGRTMALGHQPEVWSGTTFEPLETAVPQQFFGTSFLLTGLVRGILGWVPDVPAGRIAFAPQVPWVGRDVRVDRLRAGAGSWDLQIRRDAGALDVALHRRGGGPEQLRFTPVLPAGADSVRVTQDGRAIGCVVRVTVRSTEPTCDVTVADSTRLVVRFRQPPELALPPLAPRRGDPSRAVRVTDLVASGDSVAFTLEGPAGSTVRIARVDTADSVAVTFPEPGDSVDRYSRAQVRLGRR